jgi:hypothetical protein
MKISNQTGYFQGDAGWYDYNFRPVGDPAGLFGQGQEFFVQYKERVDAGMITHGNWKQHIITEGDTATVTAPSCSNSPGEWVTGDSGSFPTTYENCGGIGGTLAFMQVKAQGLQLPGIANSNFLDQDATGCPHYAGRGIPVSDPTCWMYQPDEWFTIQVHVKSGTWMQPNSLVEVWFSHAGKPAVLTENASDAAIINDGSGGASGKYGKIELSTYSTGATFTTPANAWFDDLIVSTRRIPDPDVSTPNAPDTLSLSAISSSSVTVNWRVNSQNGTAQDDTGFLVERCTGDGTVCLPNPQAGFSQIGSTATGASSFVDNTVKAGTTYTYRVRSKNPWGASAYTIAQCFNAGPSCGGTVVVP